MLLIGRQPFDYRFEFSDILLENSVVDTSSVYEAGIHQSTDIDISLKQKKTTQKLFHVSEIKFS